MASMATISPNRDANHGHTTRYGAPNANAGVRRHESRSRSKHSSDAFPVALLPLSHRPRSSLFLSRALRRSPQRTLTFPTDDEGEQWPPQDPDRYIYPEDDPNHKFELPASPWTYSNGTLNPDLHPTQTTTRRRTGTTARAKAAEGPYASVPPYHPDYQRQESHETYPVDSASEDDDDDADDDRYAYAHQGHPREFVRRGSEGYEVRPIDREEMLRRYVEDRAAEPGRYHLYVPEPPSDPESGLETEADDEQIPLAEKLERWRATSA